MKAYVVTTPLGVFGVSEEKEIVEFERFPEDPKEVAKKIVKSERGVIEEERKVYKKLSSKGFDTFFTVYKEGYGFEKSDEILYTAAIFIVIFTLVVFKKRIALTSSPMLTFSCLNSIYGKIASPPEKFLIEKSLSLNTM